MPPLPPAVRHLGVGLLLEYKTACRIIAACAHTDELKSILDLSVAMKAYAKQAKNRDLEADAKAIRMRATRQLGLMLQAQKTTVGLAKGGRPYQKSSSTGSARDPVKATYEMQGIDKHLAHDARRLGALTEDEYETEEAAERKKVFRAPGLKTKARKTKLSTANAMETAWLCASTEERAAFVAAVGLEDFWLAATPAMQRAWIAKRRQSGGFR